VNRILLSGFEPFGGDSFNPSWEVAQALGGTRIGEAEVVALELPCVFGDALAALQPSLVLALGQAAGRCDLSIERIAINVDDARIADNAGAQPIDQPVVPGGPAACFSTLPIKAMVAALQAQGVPASISQTAGTFVCNHVFYGLMHALQGQGAVRGGFMHLPLSTRQASAHPGKPTMSEVTMVEGVRLALATAWSHRGADLRLAAGALE